MDRGVYVAANPDEVAQGAGLDLPALVQRVSDGDAGAESLILTQFSRGVHCLIRKHLDHPDSNLEDMAQDVLLAVLESLRKGAVRDARALPGYVRTTAVHRAQLANRQFSQLVRKTEPLGDDDGRFVQQAAPVTDEIDSARKRRQVRELLNDLPMERDRDVLTRFYLQDQSSEEVCAALAMEPEHFRRVLHRARTRFKAILAHVGIQSAST